MMYEIWGMRDEVWVMRHEIISDVWLDDIWDMIYDFSCMIFLHWFHFRDSSGWFNEKPVWGLVLGSYTLYSMYTMYVWQCKQCTHCTPCVQCIQGIHRVQCLHCMLCIHCAHCVQCTRRTQCTLCCVHCSHCIQGVVEGLRSTNFQASPGRRGNCDLALAG